jgi:hypothetical protein
VNKKTLIISRCTICMWKKIKNKVICYRGRESGRPDRLQGCLNRRILLANEIRRGKLVRFFVLPSTCFTCCEILKKYVVSKE